MSDVLKELRALVGAQNSFASRESISCSGVSCGVPRSVLTSISGAGKTELIVQLLVENRQLKTAWVEEEFSIYPVSLLQKNVCLSRVFFVEAGKEMLWVSLQIMRCGLFDVIVLHGRALDEKSLRKMQLAAEKSRVAVLLLLEQERSLWPVHLQLRTSVGQRSNGFAEVIRKRA